MSNFTLPELGLEDIDSTRPKYERLRDHFVSEMIEGRLKPGTALPSEQRLAELFGVARNTVRQTLASLEQDGIVSRIHGKGTFIQEQALQKFRNRTGLLALIVPETQEGFYPSLLKSFNTAAEKISHQVIVCHTNNEIERQGNTILQLIDREVAGVAIVPTTTPETPVYQIRQLQKHGIPVVFCSRKVEDIQAPWLSIPFEKIGHLAGKSILQAGHRRTGFLSSHPSQATFAYESGFRRAIQELAPETSLQVYYGTGSNPDMHSREADIRAELERMVINNPSPPTALFISYDSLAEMVYLQLTQAGYRIPQDISLVSFGGSYRGSAICRQLTTITIDEHYMAEQAVSLLEQMRIGEASLDQAEQREVPISLMAGSTLIQTLVPSERNL